MSGYAPDEPGSPRLARPAAVVTALVALLVLGGLALAWVPWSWVPGGHLVPMPADRLFSTAEIARAEAYSSGVRLLSLTSYGISLGVAVLLGLTSWGARLVRAVSRRIPGGGRWYVMVPVGTLAVLLVGRLLTLPLGAAVHVRQEHYGLTHQTWGPWLVDEATSFLVSWFTWGLVLLVVVAAARRSPRWWFAWAGGAAGVLVLLGSFLYPLVVEPLFNHFTPMPAGSFRSSVLALAAKEGVHVSDVLVADASRRTTTVNAYVSGFGSTRRVVVYDNLLTEMTPAEGRLVVAHELGHARYDDVLTGTVLGAVGAVAAVAVLALLLDSRRLCRRAGVRGAADPASVALVLALAAVGGLLVSPVQNVVSRAIEARADRTAIETTGEGGAFVRMQRRLAVEALNDPTPPALLQLWFGTHPTAVQRAGLPASLKAVQR